MLLILDAVLLAIDLIFLRHGEFLGGHKVECRIEVAHSHDQRVNGTTILEVTYEIDVQILKGPLSLVDGIKVKHALRRMLVSTIACIDDRNVSHFCRILGCSLNEVTHDNNVCIVADHQNGVFQRFSFCSTGNLGIGKADDTGAKTVRSSLK